MTAEVVRLSPRASYEAGKSSPYQNDPPASRSADAELTTAGNRLRDHARYLAENSAIIASILSSRVGNAIGPGLSYEPLVRNRKGELLTEANDSIRRFHERWSRSVDVSGELSRQELERLMWRTWDIDGESFARAVRRRFGEDPQSLPYALQVVESDLIPLWMTQEFNGVYIVNGIAKDEWGRPIRYYISPRSMEMLTGFTRFSADPARTRSVPARDMWHFKRVERPDQTRGVTLFAQVIFRVQDVAQYQQSHRLAARASADLFASINRSETMDTENLYEVTEDGESKRPKRYDFQFERLMMIDGLAPGEGVNFHKPEHPNQNAVEFVHQEHRLIAAACDVGVSQVTQVFDSSYAAQRLEVVDTWRKVERDRQKFISDFARSALYEEVVRAGLRQNLIPARVLRQADPSTLLDARIDGPQMPVIDPVKDRQAYESDQANGWDSRHGIIRRMGKTPSDVDAEINSDSLPTQNSPQAQPQENNGQMTNEQD